MVKKSFTLAVSIALNLTSTFSVQTDLEKEIEKYEEMIKNSKYSIEMYRQMGEPEAMESITQGLLRSQEKLEELKKEKKAEEFLNSDKSLSEFYKDYISFIKKEGPIYEEHKFTSTLSAYKILERIIEQFISIEGDDYQLNQPQVIELTVEDKETLGNALNELGRTKYNIKSFVSAGCYFSAAKELGNEKATRNLDTMRKHNLIK